MKHVETGHGNRNVYFVKTAYWYPGTIIILVSLYDIKCCRTSIEKVTAKRYHNYLDASFIGLEERHTQRLKMLGDKNEWKIGMRNTG